MKKLILLLLLIPSLCLAGTIKVEDGGGNIAYDRVAAAPPTSCPAGTYIVYWNGDYTANTLATCYNNGATVANATNTNAEAPSTTYGEPGGDIGWQYVSQDDALVFSATAIDFTNPLTICVRFKWPASNVDVTLVEAYAATGASQINIMPDADQSVYAVWTGGSSMDAIRSVSPAVFIDDTWTTIAYSVKPGGPDDPDHSMRVNINTTTEDGDNPTQMGAGNYPTTIMLGNENIASNGSEIHVTAFAVIGGFQQPCPWD